MSVDFPVKKLLSYILALDLEVAVRHPAIRGTSIPRNMFPHIDTRNNSHVSLSQNSRPVR
jgi:hypothetical protein